MNTTDRTLSALKDWITEKATGALDSVPIYLRDDAGERQFPCIVLEESGAEEHPRLYGVLSIGVNVMVVSVPVDEPDDDDTNGTDPADHQAISGLLEPILRDETAPDWMSSRPNLKVWDMRGATGITTGEQGMRVTTFEVAIVSATI